MALTQAQLDALASGHAEAKLAVEINATTPLRFCSGSDPWNDGSNWYEPRHCEGHYYELSQPAGSKTTVKIDDRDGSIETAWYSERFSGFTVTVHILLRPIGDTGWTEVSTVVWTCEKCDFWQGDAEINLYAAAGHRKKFGLLIGSTSSFPHAPSADTTFNFRGKPITVDEPNVRETDDDDVGTTVNTKPYRATGRTKPLDLSGPEDPTPDAGIRYVKPAVVNP